MKKAHGEMTIPNQAYALLGGLTREVFLAHYWQKRPLLIRGAIPGFEGLLTPEELAGLACEDDVQSRLVTHVKGRWTVEHGPIDEARFTDLPASDWTLLVQEVNHHLDEADALLRRFDFIPHARLDDLMVSYAPDGGGVGPHFDSYDVFLLQGSGKRLWRVSEQTDLSLVEDAPLRILRRFDTEQEYLLETGDMLYLPPHVAHWGIAVGDCMTYSIGFRAPSAQELASQFLVYLQDKIEIAGMYSDPDLILQRHPAEIGESMVTRVAATLDTIDWRAADVADFLGRYLSEPKAHVTFEPPRAMKLERFHKIWQTNALRLDNRTRMLFHEQHFYINGEPVEASGTEMEALTTLADSRRLPYVSMTDNLLIERLHSWYLAGFLRFEGM